MKDVGIETENIFVALMDPYPVVHLLRQEWPQQGQ